MRDVPEAPLKFEPDGKTYRFSAPVATGKLIADTVLPTVMASPRGSEDGRPVPTNVASPCGCGDGRQPTKCGVPSGIRTRVTALKGRRPGPLDDRDVGNAEGELVGPPGIEPGTP